MHATLRTHIAREGLFDIRSQGSSPGAVKANMSVAIAGRNARRPLKSWAAAQGKVKFARAAQGPRKTSAHPNVNVTTIIKRPVPGFSKGLHKLRSQKATANDAQTLTVVGTGDKEVSRRFVADGTGFKEEACPKSA